MRSGRGPWAALGLLAVVLPSFPVAAQTLSEGQQLFYDAEFESARDTLQSVLSSPELTREQAREAHRFLAAIFALLDQTETAARHAEAAVALGRDTNAPEGASRADPIFERARARLGAEPARLELSLRDRTLTVTLQPPVSTLISEVSVSCGREGRSAAVEERAPGTTLRVPLPASWESEPVWCRAAGLSSGGAELMHARRRFGPSGSTAGLPWPWIAAGGAAAVVLTIVIVAIAAGSGEDERRVGPIEWPP